MSKIKVLWLSAISCNANAHSFLNYPLLEQFLKDFEFIYHPILDGAYNLEDVINKDLDCDILVIDGAISPEFKKSDTPIVNIINKYATKVEKIITVGTCATFGGIFKNSNYAYSTGFHFSDERAVFLFSSFKDKTISISGCPIHPEHLASVFYSIKDSLEIKLDEYLRPKEIFSYIVHNGCVRNEYFEYKIDNHKFGKKEGCMFYEHGCQGVYTKNSCNKILWNEISSKTRKGTPCFGCSEPNFPKSNLFSTKKNIGIPENLPLGVSKRSYLTFVGVAKAFKFKRLEEDLF